MARELVWRRSVAELIDNSASNGHFTSMTNLNPGETLTRTRISWVAWIPAEFPSYSVGFAVTFGVILMPASATGADLPTPWSDPNADWMWWESGLVTPRTIMGDANASPNELGISPPDAGVERDIQAMRKADATEGSRLWVVSEATTVAPLQTRHWLSVGVSSGILLPP